MTHQVISPTVSHSGHGTNASVLPSVLSLVTASAVVAIPTISRATLTFSIAGPAGSYGQATFMGKTGNNPYVPVATLTIQPNSGNSVTDVVTGSFTSLIANVDNLIKGVGAVATTSIDY